jgi:transposase
MPADLLRLPAYRLLDVDDSGEAYRVAVEVAAPVACPHCHAADLAVCGRQERLVGDFPLHGRRLQLHVSVRRFHCGGCGEVFDEALPDIDEKRLLTRRLVDWIGAQAARRSFADIAAEVGCSEFAVRAIFNDYVNELQEKVRFETPKWMGIDEVRLVKPRGVIANIQNNTVVELLPNRSSETLARYLRRLDGRERIQYVAMDMWQPYRKACQEVIPGARIVIDKFHVVKLADDALDRGRRRLHETVSPRQRRGLANDRQVLLKRPTALSAKEAEALAGWLASYDELALAYRLKEDFHDLFEAQSADDALRRYHHWQRQITPALAPAFAELVQAWEEWAPWILAYFEHPVTHTHTESLNSLIQVMSRLGRGYSFEALRARLLFAESAHQHQLSRPRFERREKERRQVIGKAAAVLDRRAAFAELLHPPRSNVVQPAPWRGLLPSASADTTEKNYGASIASLTQLIESGDL